MINKDRAEEVYKEINDKLKAEKGKIVAIDSETGDYFIGSTVIEAYEKGVKKYPGKEFFFKRIGSKHTFVVGAF